MQQIYIMWNFLTESNAWAYRRCNTIQDNKTIDDSDFNFRFILRLFFDCLHSFEWSSDGLFRDQNAPVLAVYSHLEYIYIFDCFISSIRIESFKSILDQFCIYFVSFLANFCRKQKSRIFIFSRGFLSFLEFWLFCLSH